MPVAIVPVVVMILGLLLYGYASGKAGVIGDRMFTCGLLVTLFVFAEHVLRL